MPDTGKIIRDCALLLTAKLMATAVTVCQPKVKKFTTHYTATILPGFLFLGCAIAVIRRSVTAAKTGLEISAIRCGKIAILKSSPKD
jgi:hypothetical protein